MNRNPLVAQSYTCAAASANGYANDITGAAWALTANTAGDDLAHKVTILNNSATDHSAKTVVLTGTDANDNALTETLNLPAASVSVTSTKFFKTLTSAVPSATIGADTMDIGWTAAAVSPWLKLDYGQVPFNASVGVKIGGTINFDVEHCYDVALDATALAFKHSGITGGTADDYDGYVTPVHGVRVNVNSHTAGSFTFYAAQAGRVM